MSSRQDPDPLERNRRREWNEFAEATAREYPVEVLRKEYPDVYHYLRWRWNAAEKLADETGVSRRTAVRSVREPGSDFQDLYWQARDADFPKAKGDIFDQLLIELGLREEWFWWDVGDVEAAPEGRYRGRR